MAKARVREKLQLGEEAYEYGSTNSMDIQVDNTTHSVWWLVTASPPVLMSWVL